MGPRVNDTIDSTLSVDNCKNLENVFRGGEHRRGLTCGRGKRAPTPAQAKFPTIFGGRRCASYQIDADGRRLAWARWGWHHHALRPSCLLRYRAKSRRVQLLLRYRAKALRVYKFASFGSSCNGYREKSRNTCFCSVFKGSQPANKFPASSSCSSRGSSFLTRSQLCAHLVL